MYTTLVLSVPLLLSLTAIICLLIHFTIQHIKKVKQILKVPGPERHPIFGNILQITGDEGKQFFLNFVRKSPNIIF